MNRVESVTRDTVALRLELLGGLVASPSRLDYGEWLRLLAPLTPADARVLILKVLHGLSERETAERLGVSRTRVWQLWRRALARLARCPRAKDLLGAA